MDDRRRLAGVGGMVLGAVLIALLTLPKWYDASSIARVFGAPMGPLDATSHGLHFAEGDMVLGSAVAMAVIALVTLRLPRAAVLVAAPAGVASAAIRHFSALHSPLVTAWPWLAMIVAFAAAGLGGVVWPGSRRQRVVLAARAVVLVAAAGFAGAIVGHLGQPPLPKAPVVNTVILPAA